ncbi:DEAD/DEAH box helicase family protein [Aeromonas caviae]|uniref:DEAD/DEAH box helicase family protein n=1 Tax=Aeromonas caviae TaxID=648 RepID=UPI0011194E7B|nr:DEAD/DEAH box helicase family protein [Aeromonas caviae]
MNRTITITRTESVKFKHHSGEIRSTAQRVENTYTTEWDSFCNVWSDVNKWKECDKDGKLHHTMFLGGACYTKRNDANTVFRSMFILDIDNQEGEELVTMDMVDEFLNGYDYFVYSTYSNTPEYPRFRVLIPLLDDVQASEWKERQGDMKRYFAKIVDDTSCFTLSQGQIMPCYPVGMVHNAFAKRVHGVFFDINNIPKMEKRDLVIDPNKTYNKTVYTSDIIFDYAECVSMKLAGSLTRGQAFMFACWCVANGLYEPQMINRVMKSDTNTDYMKVIQDASANYHRYCDNNYHMGMFQKYLPDDFWIKHAPTKESFKFDDSFDRFSYAKKEAANLGWDYHELGVNDKYSSIHDDIDYPLGVSMLISDCGTGKTYTYSRRPDTIVLSPYTLLAEQTTKTYIDDDGVEKSYPSNNIFYGSATYDQAETLLNDYLSGGEKNKAAQNYDYSKMTLVIDECHVLYNSSNFRRKAIRAVFAIMKLFKRVIFMSGTARPEYFSDVEFKKVVRVCKHYPFNKSVSIFTHSNHFGLAYDMIKKCQVPSIILVNLKDDIETIIENFPGVKFTIITSDSKKDDVVRSMIQRATVDDSDFIIGTISVVEGLNFEDKFDEVNVFVIHTDNTVFTTEQVEQVSNRWRNCNKINTFVFRKGDSSTNDIVAVSDTIAYGGGVNFNESSVSVEDFIRLSKENADIANRKLSRSMDKVAFISTYHNTCFTEMIRYDLNFKAYVPDYQIIDYTMYGIRRSNEQLDLDLYMFELERYGFEFNDTNFAHSLDVSELKKDKREEAKRGIEDAKKTLVDKFDVNTGRFDDTASYTKEENILIALINDVVSLGYRTDVATVLMPNLADSKNPQKFIRDVKFDLINRSNGNLITDEIRRVYDQLRQGRDWISNTEKDVLAESVLKTIKVQRYDDALHMAGGEYSKFVDVNGVLLNHKSANSFLKIFICFDTYKNGKSGLKGIQNIKFSRTGLI